MQCMTARRGTAIFAARSSRFATTVSMASEAHGRSSIPQLVSTGARIVSAICIRRVSVVTAESNTSRRGRRGDGVADLEHRCQYRGGSKSRLKTPSREPGSDFFWVFRSVGQGRLLRH
jgi:hypothetical protein